MMIIFYGKELSMHPKKIYIDKQLFANLIMKILLTKLKKRLQLATKHRW